MFTEADVIGTWVWEGTGGHDYSSVLESYERHGNNYEKVEIVELNGFFYTIYELERSPTDLRGRELGKFFVKPGMSKSRLVDTYENDGTGTSVFYSFMIASDEDFNDRFHAIDDARNIEWEFRPLIEPRSFTWELSADSLEVSFHDGFSATLSVEVDENGSILLSNDEFEMSYFRE